MLKIIKIFALMTLLLNLSGCTNKTKLSNNNSYKTIVTNEKAEQILQNISEKYPIRSDKKNRYEIILPEHEIIESNKVNTGSICVETKIFANGSEGGSIVNTYKNQILQHTNITSFGSVGKNITDYYFKDECVMITYMEIYYKSAISLDKPNEIGEFNKESFLYDDGNLYIFDEKIKGYSIINNNSYDFLINHLQKVGK